MKYNLGTYNYKVFESIKHVDEDGNEYWLARELQNVLKYKEWRNFYDVINKAKLSCSKSCENINNHFVNVNKMVKTGDSIRTISDYKLSRYACYLISLNGDVKKEVIAMAQTYFIVKARKQEIFDKDYDKLSEDEKRIYHREIIRKANQSLNNIAKESGVRNFDKFHNAGYKGLYNGETANDIFKRKKLNYREDILDNMCSEELIDNAFRIVHTNSKLKKENIKTEKDSCDVHYNIGKIVRNAIKEASGTMPEDLPTPKESLKFIDKKH
ncbi:MAG: DNA damage-inducible protein D [Bacilli bacterium]|nr:DNA damage-inducible protein D [Bacilli bacterium]